MNKRSNNTLSLLCALGYQGGTIHQVSDLTGLSVNTILEMNPNITTTVAMQGYEDAVNPQFVHKSTKKSSLFYGNVCYWSGVAFRAQKDTNRIVLSFFDRDPRTNKENPTNWVQAVKSQKIIETLVKQYSAKFVTIHNELSGKFVALYEK